MNLIVANFIYYLGIPIVDLSTLRLSFRHFPHANKCHRYHIYMHVYTFIYTECSPSIYSPSLKHVGHKEKITKLDLIALRNQLT